MISKWPKSGSENPINQGLRKARFDHLLDGEKDETIGLASPIFSVAIARAKITVLLKDKEASLCAKTTGNTPNAVHIVSLTGDKELANLLLEKEVSAVDKNGYGNTPLHRIRSGGRDLI